MTQCTRPGCLGACSCEAKRDGLRSALQILLALAMGGMLVSSGLAQTSFQPRASADNATYRVLRIPVPSTWTNVYATGINNYGKIVGHGLNGTLTQPFIADTSSFSPVPLPAGFFSGYGLAINNSGQITGWGIGLATPNPQAFIGGSGGTTAVPLTGGNYASPAYSINDRGQIAGSGFLPGLAFPFQAFLANLSGMTTVPHSGDWGDTEAFSINNLGQIAGIGDYLNGGNLQIFFGDAGGISAAIPIPSGWSVSGGSTQSGRANMQINDLGQIAATIRNADGVARVCLSTPTSTFLIPNPTNHLSLTWPSLNNVGQVVGEMGGWIWDASNGTRILDSLVAPGWTIYGASGINDQGQIVASAHNSDDGFVGLVMLDPTSTPPAQVTWVSPDAIVYGTPLGAAQLNAMASVPGTLIYVPPLGTVLNAGSNQTLSTSFTPANCLHCTPTIASVQINVQPAPLTVAANSASRVYGIPNPPLTGTIIGPVNNAATYTTTAAIDSLPGNYPITPVLTNPNNLSNYNVKVVSGTLTVTPVGSTALLINNYRLVSQQTVGGGLLNSIYRANLVNFGKPLGGLTATLTSSDPSNLRGVPGQTVLNFGPVLTNSQTTSTNTFTVLVNPSVPIDFSKLLWSFQSTPALPVANPGPNQTVIVGSTVTLDGTGSANPSAIGTLTYSWIFTSRPAGSMVRLFNSYGAAPTFVPNAPGSYVITLTVSNGASSSSANVTVTAVVSGTP